MLGITNPLWVVRVMKQFLAFLIPAAILTLLPVLAEASNPGGDFSGGVAIGTSYAGVDSAPTNGLIVQGEVGVGTTSPLQELDVNGVARAIYAELSANGAYLGFNAYYNSGWKYRASDYAYYIRNDGADISINTAPSGTAGGTLTATEAVTIESGGNVGIANTSPAYLLHVGNASASGIVMELQNSSGACTYNPGASSVTVSCSSDMRLKSDIQDSKDALAWVDDMRVRDFTVKATGERRTGIVAQEVMLKHPEMVQKNAEGTYLVDEPNPWKLVKAIQEQQGKIDKQQNEIDQLKQTIEALTQKK
jgi:hypothetical protein